VGTVALKVLDEGRGVFANGAKVDWSTPLCEKEKAVEFLEEDGRGLVDGAEDGLPVVGEFPHEAADGPGGLGVEAGGWLVEKEK